MKEKILITGSRGDLGKNIISRLKENNLHYVGMSRKKFVENEVTGDLCDYESLRQATKGVNIVVHCAALQSGSKKDIYKVNVKGTENLIRACKENKVKGFIFISSFDSKFNNAYGKSKRLGEKILKDSGLNFVIIRPTVIYGKGFKKNIAKLVDFIKKYPLVPVVGGNNLYQPVRADDISEIVVQIIKKNKFTCKEYFAAGKDIVSMRQLIDLIESKIGRKTIKINIPSLLLRLFLNSTFNNKTVDKSELEKLKKDFAIEMAGIKNKIDEIL